MKKKIICAALAALLILPILFAAGCSDRKTPEETTGEDSTAEVQTGVPEGSDEKLTVGDLAKFVLVRPDRAGDGLVDDATMLYKKLQRFAPDMQIKSDFYKEGIPLLARAEYEILVGLTEREESASFTADMRAEDYGYALVGKKLVIAGTTEEATSKAITAFIVNVIAKADASDPSSVFFDGANSTLVRAKYAVDKLSVAGVPVQEFRVIYPYAYGTSGKVIAELFADKVREATGYILEVATDRAAGEPSAHEILIGETDRGRGSADDPGADGAVISFENGSLRVWASDKGAVSHALISLVSEFSEVRTDELSIAGGEAKVIKYEASELTAMSFNVLVSQKTSERDARVIKMVLSYLPDTVGFQEASPAWMATLSSGLSSDYAWVGEGREGGSKGEYNPIFYRKDKFNLISSGTKWLSDTPDVVSKYSDSNCYRIYTYALLEKKDDGTRIMVVNTHLDHVGESARRNQAAVLAKFLSKNALYPIILTGDFNTTEDSAAYSTVIGGGVSDSRRIASTAEPGATYTNYGASSKVIDFIFVSPVFTQVGFYRVCNEMIDGNWPSDHHPVFIRYTVAG
ncbi:MAG: endonuclease/exonuclease/phosphatase family protein [Clostridia bacterium]|nr:endonuclease/exonuclease/phosphatase family protein [Clostridia bacterium]MBP5270870.1 endonuclease/exonuclease/phosphatase family protein [Clostridia bacterium]